MKLKKEILFFLTACIQPKGMTKTVLQDANVRLQQYLEAINFYLNNYCYKILVVENTNVDLYKYLVDPIENGQLEYLTFDGNNFDPNLGKGFGEGLIIKYAFAHSHFIRKYNYIVKITGRHKITNLEAILTVSEIFLGSNPNLIVCDIIPKRKVAISDCFIASKSFFELYLNENLHLCNDSMNIWFEHILFYCIHQAKQENFQYLFLPFALDQRGCSGSTGRSFSKTRLRRKIYYFVKMLFYKLNLDKFVGKSLKQKCYPVR